MSTDLIPHSEIEEGAIAIQVSLRQPDALENDHKSAPKANANFVTPVTNGTTKIKKQNSPKTVKGPTEAKSGEKLEYIISEYDINNEDTLDKDKRRIRWRFYIEGVQLSGSKKHVRIKNSENQKEDVADDFMIIEDLVKRTFAIENDAYLYAKTEIIEEDGEKKNKLTIVFSKWLGGKKVKVEAHSMISSFNESCQQETQIEGTQNNSEPKIMKTYFAKKNETVYTKISKARLEDEVYIIVETENLEGEKVSVKIQEQEEQLRLLKNKEDVLPVLVFDHIDDTETDTEANPSIEMDIVKESAQKIGRQDEAKIELGIKKIKLRPKQDTIENEQEDLVKSLEGWEKTISKTKTQEVALKLVLEQINLDIVEIEIVDEPLICELRCSDQWMDGAPNNMADFKIRLSEIAKQEYRDWHTGGGHGGNAYWESDRPNLDENLNAETNIDPFVKEKLMMYWRACWSYTRGRRGAQINDRGAKLKINSRAAWSAAFISYAVKSAGIESQANQDNDIFTHSIRHVDFFREAKRNKTRSKQSNPFWAYPREEYAPEVGDIICRSKLRHENDRFPIINYDNIHNRYTGASHSDIVVRVPPPNNNNPEENYIIVIGGNLEYDCIYNYPNNQGQWVNRIPISLAASRSEIINTNARIFIDDEGEEHARGTSIPYGQDLANVSVGKRKIYLTDDGKIDPDRRWVVINNSSSNNRSERVQFTGPQTEYFAIIKIRTCPCDD